MLVLDLDSTLIYKFCDKNTKECESLRPHLHHFLSRAYEKYNLVLWSASDMTRIKKIMKRLHLNEHKYYRLAI